MARTGAIALGLAAVLAIAACGGKEAPKDPTPTHTKAEVKAQVQAQADNLAKLVGQPLQSPKIDPALCIFKKKKNDGSVVVMQGTYSIALPAEQHAAMGAKIRDSWKAAGYTITKDSITDKSVSELVATTPDKFTLRLSSSEPPKAFVILIQSSCFKATDAATT